MKTPGNRRRAESSSGWLAHAVSDLSLARLGRDHPEILREQVCFHAQQAAEKALKAVLVERKIGFPLIHDIEALLDIAEKAGLELPPEFAEAGFLTPFAVEARYPGYGEEVAQTDVEEAIRLAGTIVSWAVSLIPSPSEGGRGEGDPRGDEGSSR